MANEKQEEVVARHTHHRSFWSWGRAVSFSSSLAETAPLLQLGLGLVIAVLLLHQTGDVELGASSPTEAHFSCMHLLTSVRKAYGDPAGRLKKMPVQGEGSRGRAGGRKGLGVLRTKIPQKWAER